MLIRIGYRMAEFDIYFEIYGKKLKTTITANSKNEAMQIVRNKIKFNKVIQIKQDDGVEFLKGIFGME